MDKAPVEDLASKHAALHALIDEEEHRPHPDEDLLHRLKKEKLRLKDEMLGHYPPETPRQPDARRRFQCSPMPRIGCALQSSRDTFSTRSWRSCASRVIFAIGRASSRASEIGSPVTSQ